MFYPVEIEKLLKEVVKNAVAEGENSKITEKVLHHPPLYSFFHHKIFIWLEMITLINKQADNLDYQTFYLELLGLMCIEKNGKGIRKYQHIIEQELLSK